MLKVEYLIFIDNQSVKCSDAKTFNHLLQSDPQITINNKKLTYKGFTVDYNIKNGKVKNTDNSYFHLTFECDDDKKIDDFNKLLKAVKSVLHITNKAPQTLYDGVSLHYTQLAYPLVFDIENLMRKLITKFMLTNVGIDWIKERVPDDVKSSINSENKDLTYLHNVDFIQLKNFLFSENYPSHKDTLIQKLKKAKEISDVNIDDIKSLIPISNWEKYFSEKVNTTKEQLNKQWDELYDLRCRIAHNRAFTKTDYEDVVRLSSELKIVIQNAIENLDKIDISETEREQLTESIAGNFNTLFGEYIGYWRELTHLVRLIVRSRVASKYPERKDYGRMFSKDLDAIKSENIISPELYIEIKRLYNIRNEVMHNSLTLSEDEILNCINVSKDIILELRNWL